jgi:type I restriction enzyme, S subunit
MTLPKGWAEAAFEEIGRWGSGGTPKASEPSFYGGEIPWIRSGDLPDGPIERHEIQISSTGLENSSAKWIDKGAVLIAMYGATIGKLGFTTYPVTTNQAVAFVEPYEGIEARYLFGNLRFRKPELVALGQGGAQPNISQEIIKEQKLPLPPTAEQRRIVTKLDALIARIARARAALDRVPVLAAHLRAAALTVVCKDVRSTQLVPISALAITTFDGPFGSNLKSADYTQSGIRVIRLENIGHLRFVSEKETFISASKYEMLTRHTLMPGDILFSSFVDREVRVCQFPGGDVPAINKADCFVIRINPMIGDVRFITYMLASTDTYEAMKANVHGATRPRIGLSQLRDYALHLPSLAEQSAIADRLDAAFARTDRLEAEAARARALLDRLESSILAKAFRGELVPQDANDEPASVLLERIRAQRAASPKRTRARQTAASA